MGRWKGCLRPLSAWGSCRAGEEDQKSSYFSTPGSYLQPGAWTATPSSPITPVPGSHTHSSPHPAHLCPDLPTARSPGRSWLFSCGVAKFNFAYVAEKLWLFIIIPACLQGTRWKLDHVKAFYFLQRCVCKTLVENTMQMSDNGRGRTSSPAWGKWGRSNSYPDFHQLWGWPGDS